MPEPKFKVGDLVEHKKIDHPFWRYGEVRGVQETTVFVALCRGHDEWNIEDVKLCEDEEDEQEKAHKPDMP